MTRHYSRNALASGNGAPAADIVGLPGRPVTNRTDRVFGLHPALHIATFAGFAVWLGIMWAAFADPGLIVPFGIFAVFLAMAFAVPALWARVARDEGPKASWEDFLREGFDCATGHLSGREAVVQVMIIPGLLVIWGLCVALIRAFV
jgi:hypothetical protein